MASVPEMLAEELLPEWFYPREGEEHTWGDNRYSLKIRVRGDQFTLVLVDLYAKLDDTQDDYVWTHAEEFANPRSFPRATAWVLEQIERQDGV